jgi:hypothetical protein
MKDLHDKVDVALQHILSVKEHASTMYHALQDHIQTAGVLESTSSAAALIRQQPPQAVCADLQQALQTCEDECTDINISGVDVHATHALLLQQELNDAHALHLEQELKRVKDWEDLQTERLMERGAWESALSDSETEVARLSKALAEAQGAVGNLQMKLEAAENAANSAQHPRASDLEAQLRVERALSNTKQVENEEQMAKMQAQMNCLQTLWNAEKDFRMQGNGAASETSAISEGQKEMEWAQVCMREKEDSKQRMAQKKEEALARDQACKEQEAWLHAQLLCRVNPDLQQQQQLDALLSSDLQSMFNLDIQVDHAISSLQLLTQNLTWTVGHLSEETQVLLTYADMC